MNIPQFLKSALASAMFLSAMAFSCQDHHPGPEPDPVANCELVDGGPRAFPCEFKIVKLEFLRGNTSQVVRTFKLGDEKVALPSDGALAFFWLSKHSHVYMQYRVRVHVKRIAPASFQPVGGYELVYYRLTPGYPPYPPAYNDVIGQAGDAQTAANTPPASPAKRPVSFDMPVGETRTGELMVVVGLEFEMSGGVHFGDILIGVVNNTTALTLMGAPHNYKRGRDVQEARLAFKPEWACDNPFECKKLNGGTWQPVEWSY